MNLEEELNMFSGTERWYIHWTGRLVYTDGIQYLCEKAECY